MKTPKQRFLEIKPVAQAHRDTVDRSETAIAMDYALLDFAWNMPKSKDAQEAAANCYRLEGAVEFVKKLVHLGDMTPEKQKTMDGNLNHNA